MAKIAERYAYAVGSKNLQNDERHSQPDILAAMALSSPFACLLFRVKYANDKSSYKQLRTEWIERVTEKADIQHWPTRIKPGKVATEALNYWLDDKCDPCDGLGYQKHENAPHLTEIACHICKGSGLSPIKFGKEFEKYALDIMEDLNQICFIGASIAIKKEANEMETMFTAYAKGEKLK